MLLFASPLYCSKIYYITVFCSKFFQKCLELSMVQACFFDEIHTLNTVRPA